MSAILPLIWILMIAFFIVMYVILDGFTLGTAMLMPFMKKSERDLAISVILPTWDGNQTWLVLGMASLYGAFPFAFSALLPVLYLPLILMVVALLLRGVVFEFRLKSHQAQARWDTVMIFASFIVVLIQGVVLGNFVEGFIFSVQPHIVSGKALITPFTLFTACSLVFGYMLLGATRLIIKTEANLQAKMYRLAFWLSIIVMLCIVIVSVWTPFLNSRIYARWFENHHWIYLAILPYITAIAFLILIWSLHKKAEIFPYWCSVILFACPYIGFMISLYPYLVPFKITVWQAASPDNTLLFLLIGAVIMIPVLLIYTGYSYHIFRGKVKDVIKY